MSLEPIEVEVPPRSRIALVSTFFCWFVFAIGALFLPIRFAVLGFVDSVSLFGFPLQPDRVVQIQRDWTIATFSALAATGVLLVVAVAWRLRGRTLVSSWVTAAAAGVMSVLIWGAGSLAPSTGF